MDIKVFDYDGYKVETKDEQEEQITFNRAVEIKKEYSDKGICIELMVARNIALFEKDEELYFDDSIISPDGLDPDRHIPFDFEGKTEEEIEKLLLEKAISDAYGCAVNCKPNYIVEDLTEYAFPSVNAWVEWHRETIEKHND